MNIFQGVICQIIAALMVSVGVHDLKVFGAFFCFGLAMSLVGIAYAIRDEYTA